MRQNSVDVAAASEQSGGFPVRARAATARGANASPVAPRHQAGDSDWMTPLCVLFLLTVVGYYALNYWGGSKYDWLGIPLPGIRHAAEEKSAEESHGSHPHDHRHDPAVRPVSHTAATAQGAAPSFDDEAEEDYEAGEEPLAAANSPRFSPAELPTVPAVTPADLRSALEQVQQAICCPECRGEGVVHKRFPVRSPSRRNTTEEVEREFVCPACQGRPIVPIDRPLYLQLCQLAAAATHVEIDPGSDEYRELRQRLRSVLLQAASDQGRLENLGRLGLAHLNDFRQAHQGVLLAGTVQEVTVTESGHATRIALAGVAKRATILSAAPPRLQTGAVVLVAGVILPDGNAAMLPSVWGGVAVPWNPPSDGQR